LLVFRLQESREFLLETRDAAATINNLLLPACPRGMRFGVDVQVQHVTLLAPRGARGEFASVSHHHLDGVVVGMGILLHRFKPGPKRHRYWLVWALLYRSEPGAASGRN